MGSVVSLGGRAATRPAEGLAGEGDARPVRGRRPAGASGRRSVDYKATIDDPRISEVRILRPQEIPIYVAEGLFDIGITGRDWVEETGSDVVSLGELKYSKATSNPIKLVVAVAGDSPAGVGRRPARRRAGPAPSTPS